MKKYIDYYKEKKKIKGQNCFKCKYARFTLNKKENYCEQTKRFGKPRRGCYCKHYCSKTE